jgi:hypothetical protein
LSANARLEVPSTSALASAKRRVIVMCRLPDGSDSRLPRRSGGDSRLNFVAVQWRAGEQRFSEDLATAITLG